LKLVEAQAQIAKTEQELASKEQELKTARDALAELNKENARLWQDNGETVNNFRAEKAAEVDQIQNEIESLKAQLKSDRPATQAAEAQIAQLELILKNVATSPIFFPGTDPSADKIEPAARGPSIILDRQGHIGESHILAGNQEGSMRLKFADG